MTKHLSLEEYEDMVKRKVNQEIKVLPEEMKERIQKEIESVSKKEWERRYEIWIEDTPKNRKESARIQRTSEKYKLLAISNWPDFEVKWDINPCNYRFALDNVGENAYAEMFPEGLLLGWVSFEEFKVKLADHSKREKKHLWETCGHQKLARAILYCVEGNKMTPPLIHPDHGSVMIGGGFHRIGICLAKDVVKIPFLVCPKEREEIDSILVGVEWY